MQFGFITIFSRKVAVVKRLLEKMGKQMLKYLHPRQCNEELHTIFITVPTYLILHPGMCEIMTVWDADGTKHKLRKYYLTMYLREPHAIFQQTHCDISLSIFCKLRPKNLLLIGDSPKNHCKPIREIRGKSGNSMLL